MKTKKILLRLLVLSASLLLCGMTADAVVLDEKAPSDKDKQVKTPQYAPGEIIIKFKSGEALQEKKRLSSEKGTPAAQESIKPQISENIRADLYKDEAFTIRGSAIREIKDLPEKVKSLVKDDTALEPVFKGLHRKMQKAKKTEDQINKETFQNLSLKRRLPDKGLKNYHMQDVYILKNIDTKGKSIEELCRELQEDPNVEYAEPNYIMKVQMVPNDPYYHSQGSWGQAYDDLWGIKKIQCEEAWDTAQGEGVIVAVIDTGVDYNHEDLAENIWINEDEIPGDGIDNDENGYIDDIRGWDFAYGDNDPMDGHGHGTHCSGTIAAIGNNNVGVIGVAPKAKIMAVKGLDDGGSGWVSDLADCVYYAADPLNGADVLSNSWGGPGTDETLKLAFDYAYDLGCVNVAAAGNSNADVAFFNPANIDTVIAVAASNQNDEKCSFSNWGAKIDVSAPGGDSETGDGDNVWGRNILSLRSDNNGKPTDMYDDGKCIVGDSYYRSRGTSMACPHVAGLAALILSYHPNFTNEDVKQAMTSSASDLGEPGWDMKYGFGRINTFKALNFDFPLKVSIDSPAWGDIVIDIEEIIGTVEGTNLFSYHLDHSQLMPPNGRNGYTWVPSWTQIGEIYNSPIKNGIIGRWDTNQFTDGRYLLRLIAEDNIGRTFIDMAAIEIDNVYISSPSENKFFGIADRRDLIPVVGTVAGSNLDSFVISYGEGAEPSDWHTAGVTLVEDGTNPIIDNLLGNLDASYFRKVGTYTIKLEARYKEGRIEEDRVYCIFDPTMKQCWPLIIDGLAVWGVGTSPIIVDLNNDGQDELLVLDASNLYIINSKAQILNKLETGYGYQAIVSDINKDGKKELVYSGRKTKTDVRNITAINLDVNMQPKEIFKFEFPEPFPQGMVYNFIELAAADVVGDKKEEICIGVRGYVGDYPNHDATEIFLIDARGNLLLDKRIEGISTPFALGDISGDSHSEIVFEVDDEIENYIIGRIEAWDGRGNSVENWPKTLNMNEFTAPGVGPVIGNLDGSGNKIVMATYVDKKDGPGESRVYAFNGDGTLMQGLWPVSGTSNGGVSLGDLNGDKKLEILVNDGHPIRAEISIYNSDGSIFTKLDKGIGDPYNGFQFSAGNCYNAPPVADVDGDNLLEIISGGMDYVPAWKVNGDMISDTWPKIFLAENFPNMTHPALGDLDGDGKLEMAIVQGRTIAVWELEGSYADWPMFGHDPQHTNCYISTNSPPVLAPIGNKVVQIGHILLFPISAVDPDKDKIRYGADNLPDGAKFTPMSKPLYKWFKKRYPDLTYPCNLFYWRPKGNQAGKHKITFWAEDLDNKGNPKSRTSQEVTITVKRPRK